MAEKNWQEREKEYVEQLVDFIRDHGIDWMMPENFAQWSSQDKSRYTHNLRQIYRIHSGQQPPEAPDSLSFFVVVGIDPYRPDRHDG